MARGREEAELSETQDETLNAKADPLGQSGVLDF